MSPSDAQAKSRTQGPERRNGNDPNHNRLAPTNETVEPKDRKRKLVRKPPGASRLKYALWLAGHGCSVVFGLVALVWQVLWLPNVCYVSSISYRLSLLGALVALASTVWRKYGLRYLPPFSTLLAQQNFQYLVTSLVWCVTFKSVLKIIPTLLISVLQLSVHKKIHVVLKQSEFLASVIAFDELALVVYLLIRTLLFRSTSGYQMMMVVVFLWLRVLFDRDTANLLGYVVQKADGRMSSIQNETVNKTWVRVKHFLAEKRRHGIYSDGLKEQDTDFPPL